MPDVDEKCQLRAPTVVLVPFRDSRSPIARVVPRPPDIADRSSRSTPQRITGTGGGEEETARNDPRTVTRIVTGLGGTGVSEQAHRWAFTARFRRHAFGWKSQPAIQRVKQAVTEIKGVARRDPLLGAEGAVASSSGVAGARARRQLLRAIGTAVNHAIEHGPVIAERARGPRHGSVARSALGGPRSRPDALH